MQKRRLDAFFAGDVSALINEARKDATQARSTRSSTKRRVNAQGADVAAMTALAAGMPGKALRRLWQNGTLPPSAETLAALQELHPQAAEPPQCENLAPIPILSQHHANEALRSMRQSAPRQGPLVYEQITCSWHFLTPFQKACSPFLTLSVKAGHHVGSPMQNYSHCQKQQGHPPHRRRRSTAPTGCCCYSSSVITWRAASNPSPIRSTP